MNSGIGAAPSALDAEARRRDGVIMRATRSLGLDRNGIPFGPLRQAAVASNVSAGHRDKALAGVTRITEAQWVDYFGFRRFPFDRLEAENEELALPGFLATCFVEPRSFARVLGQADAPVSSLLFAARGTGKTACRVMLQYYCQTGQVNAERRRIPNKTSFVLSVPHVHLQQVLSMAKAAASPSGVLQVSVECHAVEILRRAVPALADSLAKAPELSGRLRQLSVEDRLDLSWLIVAYGHYLSLAQATFLSQLGVAFPDFGHPPIGFRVDDHPSARGPDWTAAIMHGRATASPLDHITQFARIMPRLGFLASYVLIDGIDEFEESADNPQFGFAVLRPLLACLRLMDETPHLALKYFLPANLEPLVRTDEAVRRDRGFVIETIIWTEADLVQILRRRLDALKAAAESGQDRMQAGFDALCVPDLHGQVEHDLATVAAGNPRHLLVLCGLMVSIHCSEDVSGQDDPYQLNRHDFETAVHQFLLNVRPDKQMLPAANSRIVIQEIIARGEDERTEFKSSLRWDYKAEIASRNSHYIVAKTIAGLLNADGGILVIGVADDGAILGIEPDLKTLNRPTLDGYRLAVTEVVKTYLGVDYVALLQMLFERIEEKWVCAISVDRSPQPVFVKMGDSHEFWVRLGSSTRNLDAFMANRYIRTHWTATR